MTVLSGMNWRRLALGTGAVALTLCVASPSLAAPQEEKPNRRIEQAQPGPLLRLRLVELLPWLQPAKPAVEVPALPTVAADVVAATAQAVEPSAPLRIAVPAAVSVPVPAPLTLTMPDPFPVEPQAPAKTSADPAISRTGLPLTTVTPSEAGGSIIFATGYVEPMKTSAAEFVVPEAAAPDFPPASTTILPKDHPAVGSYIGKAIQVCPSGVAPSACFNGQPAGVLFMTPSLTGDGLLIADDSLTLLETPFGPHATAHGSWTPTSATEFTAEYVFMTKPYPLTTDARFTGVRARWVAKVLDANTLVGWVNAYFLTNTVPSKWTPLAFDQFPELPTEALPFYTAPNGFITDPNLCLTSGCPLVFKFTLKRVAR